MIFDGDRHELGQYMRHMADLMGLRDWYLTLTHKEPLDDDHGAECDVSYGQKCARIAFRDDWPTWDAEEVRRLMVHELIHRHVEPMRWAMNNTKHVVGAATFEVIADGFMDVLEVAVDGMAREWARHLPLPVKDAENDAQEAV